MLKVRCLRKKMLKSTVLEEVEDAVEDGGENSDFTVLMHL